MFAIEDYLHPLKSRYRTSPHWFKATVGWAYSQLPRKIRYGATLASASAFLAHSQWLGQKELREYEWRQLKRLLDHAYAYVPYYREAWSAAGLAPMDIRSLADFKALPVLTKEIVRDNKSHLVATNYRHRLLATNTGGSTGRPLTFFWEKGRTRALERAFMWRQWRWAGFEYGERTAVLRGQTVGEGISHYDPIDKHLFLSGFNLRADTASQYLSLLRDFRPVSIQAYPSAITVLANHMKRHNEPRLEGLKVILAGSENLYPSQRALLEEVFGCRVFGWYGQGEAVCLAGGCDKSDLYHVYTEYGYTELIDEAERVLEWSPGAKGEIVATGFNNYAMPLIRYRTGDIAVVGPEQCPCGRHYPLWERIEGRRQEYVVGGDGKLVPLTAFIFGQHYRAFEKIERMQIVQERPGALTVNLKVFPEWASPDEIELRRDMMRAIGHEFELDICHVNGFDLTRAGKHRFVVQKIPLPNLWAGEQGA